MTEEIAEVEDTETALDLTGGVDLGNLPGSVAYVDGVWKKTQDKDKLDAAKAQGADPGDSSYTFGIKRAAGTEYRKNFEFLMWDAQPCQSVVDAKGKTQRLAVSIGKDDPDYSKARQDYLALIIVYMDGDLIPAIASPGQFGSGKAAILKNAMETLATQYSDVERLKRKGDAYVGSASVDMPKLRAVFRASGKVKETNNGFEMVQGNVSQRPLTTKDLENFAAADLKNPASQFQKNLSACFKRYNQQKAEIVKGWKRPAGK